MWGGVGSGYGDKKKNCRNRTPGGEPERLDKQDTLDGYGN